MPVIQKGASRTRTVKSRNKLHVGSYIARWLCEHKIMPKKVYVEN